MTIPWMYYFNVLLIPLVFGYLTAANYNHSFKPRGNSYGWFMFYILLDGVILGFQKLFHSKRLFMTDTWEYAAIAQLVCFLTMVLVLVLPRTPLKKILPHWVKKEEANKADADKAQDKKKDNKEKKENNAFRIIWMLFFLVVYIAFLVLFFGMRWYEQTFDVDFDAFLFTINSPAKGTGSDIVNEALLMIVPPIILMMPLYTVSVIAAEKRKDEYTLMVFGRHLSAKGFRRVARGITVFLIILFAIFFMVILKLPEYLASRSRMSTIYEENYVNPNKVKLTSETEKPRNLIFIVMESMEATYASKDMGGVNSINYIDKMCQLADENISFSNTDKLGGFMSVNGTGWTMGATIGFTSGVPFSFPVGQNSLGRYENIAGGLTTFGDIFEKKGYNLEAVFGTDATFAGTQDFFEQHGGYKVFDLDDFYEKGYVEDGFYEWWGVRDQIVYMAFQDEIGELAKQDAPFAITMFTMDTHATYGYECEICQHKYKSKTGNVLSCAQDQVTEFIRWCKLQPWYDNTTIVVIGDHPRMDSQLIGGLDPHDRRVYNCIINSAKQPAGETKNRTFTTLDLFPTIISAMGYDIPGNMLGLGTDMLSGQPTLAEKYGLDWLNDQLAMKSDYYVTHFY
ncbi:MAG: LTA synthase family protein [Lachnospiraceae bacterium]|nr:LTA synthase family protein [Lachnospiraceae bacterium]